MPLKKPAPMQGRRLFVVLFTSMLMVHAAGAQEHGWNERDKMRQEEYLTRQRDWRNGAVVYQIMVDRFAPSRRLEAKRSLYGAPRRLHEWKETPAKGPYLEKDEIWSHEVDYWGGDLDSLKNRLDYVQGLGADVVYLNPICESLSNHKYDASDYQKVDPVYGDRQELARLASDVHERGMKIMLDGVFNHMGRRSPMFRDAQTNENSRWKDFFVFRDPQRKSYVGWMDVANLPELNLENPTVKDFIYRRPDSVIQSYLRQEQIDGWRLDVAFDLGFSILGELTQCAHEARPGCAVIGEVWNYPEEWHPALDAVMNMHSRAILLHMLKGQLSPAMASAMWDTMLAEAGYEHLLKAWLVLENHDTPRLVSELPQPWQQKMARVLQFTLPGTVCLYYGGELGMSGGEDPENRAPMRWDLATPDNPTLSFYRRLLKLRHGEPALRWGDFRRLHSEKLFAFLRRSLSAKETVVVIANPSDKPVTEFLQLRESKLQDVTPLRNILATDPSKESFVVFAGGIDVTIPAHEVFVLKPDVSPYPKGYDRYDRLP